MEDDGSGGAIMASITVRNLDDGLKRRLRIRAAENGRSMEQEAREILKHALEEDTVPVRNLGTALHELFRPFGGVDLEIPPRQPMREPPRFD
jgi:plasmid stability protein